MSVQHRTLSVVRRSDGEAVGVLEKCDSPGLWVMAESKFGPQVELMSDWLVQYPLVEFEYVVEEE